MVARPQKGTYLKAGIGKGRYSVKDGDLGNVYV